MSTAKCLCARSLDWSTTSMRAGRRSLSDRHQGFPGTAVNSCLTAARALYRSSKDPLEKIIEKEKRQKAEEEKKEARWQLAAATWNRCAAS